MKRILKIVAIVVVLLVIVVAIPIASAFVGRRAIADGTEFNGVRIVRDGIVSVAVVPVGPRTVALIDAGNDKSGMAILAELSRRNLGPDAVVAILLTHGHPDHTGAVGLFPQAQVVAMEAEVPLVEGRAGSRGPLTRLMPVSPTGIKVTHPAHDGETLSFDQTQIRAFAVPGHTAGSAAYLVNGVLFLGDAADIASGGNIQGAPWIFSDSQAEDRASLVHLAQMLGPEADGVKAIVCSHSGIITDGLGPLAAYDGK